MYASETTAACVCSSAELRAQLVSSLERANVEQATLHSSFVLSCLLPFLCSRDALELEREVSPREEAI